MLQTPEDAWTFGYRNFAPQWFDGLPLGNGDLGALVMADHKRISIPLAKSDLWDERCDDGTGQRRSFRPFKTFAELRALIAAGNWDAIDELFSKRDRNWTGKFGLIPAGALVLRTDRFEKEIEILDWKRGLDLRSGMAEGSLATRVRRQHAEALVSVAHDVLALRVRHDMDWRKGHPPRQMSFGMDIELEVKPNDPQARVQSGVDQGVLWTRVRGYHQLDYTIAVWVDGIETAHGRNRLTATAKDRADFFIYVAVGTREDAFRRVRAAARIGYARIRSDHRRWWRKFWSASQVEIPDERILRQYHFGLYLLGSSSRRGCRMPGLQGVWSTRAAGSSWNEYTNDLNIQMNYWPIYASNHLELGWPYYDTVRAWLPEARRYTRDYWGCRGVQFSCCASPSGIIPPAYLTSMHWAGHAAFVAQNFWTHWLYSRDTRFLREVAYPFLKACAEFHLDFLKKDRLGRYDIWPSNTPEAGEGSYEAWGRNATMDIALLRMLFRAIIESARVLGADAAFAAQCRERLENLPPYPQRAGALIDMESKEFIYSHRHIGMLTPIYPCADVGGRLAEKSIDRFLRRGKWLWSCFTPVWLAAAYARIGRGEMARDLLQQMFEQFFPPQGGFNLSFNLHRSGEGSVGPAVFCNETNSGFSAALLEMLLQSHNGIIRVFPAVPGDWQDVSFRNLRAEGALLVSATRKQGRTTEVVLRGLRGGTLRIESPWTGKIERLAISRGQIVRLHKQER